MKTTALKSCVIGLLFVMSICLGVSQLQSQQLSHEDQKAKIESKLQQLRRAESQMGDRHPKYAEVLGQIEALENQLADLLLAPNPFAETTDQRDRNAELVERLSDAELRFLVIRMATEVKTLTKRIEILEARNGIRNKNVF